MIRLEELPDPAIEALLNACDYKAIEALVAASSVVKQRIKRSDVFHSIVYGARSRANERQQKALNAFKLFVHYYTTSHTDLSGRSAVVAASHVWGTLDEASRVAYHVLYQKIRDAPRHRCCICSEGIRSVYMCGWRSMWRVRLEVGSIQDVTKQTA